ncbi:MAG: hypothetical protein WAN46_17160 [Gammaproteobacteria bacterium]
MASGTRVNVAFFVLPVGIFSSKSAVAKRHGVLFDVVAKAEASQSESVLTFAWRHSLKLFDGMRSRTVVGVVSEGVDGNGKLLGKIRLPFPEIEAWFVR